MDVPLEFSTVSVAVTRSPTLGELGVKSRCTLTPSAELRSFGSVLDEHPAAVSIPPNTNATAIPRIRCIISFHPTRKPEHHSRRHYRAVLGHSQA
jgi:hypothetical protein